MIPYVGCKQSIASELLAQIPEAEHFYDLFGGSGSVTETALKLHNKGILGTWSKWQHIHYNELNTGVYLLNKEVWEGTFDFDKARRTWISRERFFAEKDVQCRMTKKDGKGIYRTEKLFWNGRKHEE